MTTLLGILGALLLGADGLMVGVLAIGVLGAYQAGFRRLATDDLSATVRRRLLEEDRLRTVKDLDRQLRLARAHAEALGDRSDPGSNVAALAAALGRRGDLVLLDRLASRRRHHQQLALGRFGERMRAADAATLLKFGQWWLWVETVRLASVAAAEVGPTVASVLVDEARGAIGTAMVAIPFGICLVWYLLAGARIGVVSTYAVAAVLIPVGGAFLGIGRVLARMLRRAFTERSCANSTGGGATLAPLVVAAALSLAVFLSIYLGWLSDAQGALLGLKLKIPRRLAVVVGTALANAAYVWAARRAHGVWRLGGVALRSQRLQVLGAAIFATGLLVYLDGLGLLGILGEARSPALFCLSLGSVGLFMIAIAVDIAAWVVRRGEPRSPRGEVRMLR